MKIITSVVNNPDFIEIQFYNLKRYCKDSFEFIVFNDAKEFPDYTNGGNPKLYLAIESKCRSLGIRCIRIPNGHHGNHTGGQHNSSDRCADAMNYMFKFQLEHPDRYLVIDSDMFPICEFSIDKYASYDAAIVLQSVHNETYHYMWNGLYYLNMLKTSDLHMINWNRIPGLCDVGGYTNEWFMKLMRNQPVPKIADIRWTDQTFHNDTFYFIKHLYSCTWDESEAPEYIKENTALLHYLKNDPRNVDGKFFCELYDSTFLHYRAGGNWRQEGLVFHLMETNKLKAALLEYNLNQNNDQ
jgi:hypothetical protein